MTPAGAVPAAALPSAVGIGLRAPHHHAFLFDDPPVPWLEILADNYLAEGGPSRDILRRIAAIRPVGFHTVGMDIGGTDPLDLGYLRRLRILVDEIRPAALSDHLAWVAIDGVRLHDLMPLPRNEAVARHAADRLRALADLFGRTVDVEHVSAYGTPAETTMPEPEFVALVADLADVRVLVDLGNLVVNARNLGTAPDAWFSTLDADRVAGYHLGGHHELGDALLDSHGAPLAEATLDLFGEAIHRWGPRPAIVEWDAEIPDLAALLEERRRAQGVMDDAVGR